MRNEIKQILLLFVDVLNSLIFGVPKSMSLTAVFSLKIHLVKIPEAEAAAPKSITAPPFCVS